MDRRIFVALMTLASAAGVSPVLAEQIRHAEATGDMRHISQDELLRSIYSVSMSPNGARVGAKALVELGHNPQEAAEMTELAISISHKAGSYANFKGLISGDQMGNVQLSAREMALLRSVAARGGEAAKLHTKWDGRTWEGSSS